MVRSGAITSRARPNSSRARSTIVRLVPTGQACTTTRVSGLHQRAMSRAAAARLARFGWWVASSIAGVHTDHGCIQALAGSSSPMRMVDPTISPNTSSTPGSKMSGRPRASDRALLAGYPRRTRCCRRGPARPSGSGRHSPSRRPRWSWACWNSFVSFRNRGADSIQLEYADIADEALLPVLRAGGPDIGEGVA